LVALEFIGPTRRWVDKIIPLMPAAAGVTGEQLSISARGSKKKYSQFRYLALVFLTSGYSRQLRALLTLTGPLRQIWPCTV
jgi:hypothetical protein